MKITLFITLVMLSSNFAQDYPCETFDDEMNEYFK